MTVSSARSASVVIATFDKARYLDLTLASYLHQRGLDGPDQWELVLVDDGSTDDTAQVIAEYAPDLPMVVVRQTNRGRAAARNAGLRAASGDVIIFADDDRVVPVDFITAHLAGFGDGARDLLRIGYQRGILTHWLPGLDARDRLAPLFAQHPDLRQQLPADAPKQLVSAEDIRDRFDATVTSYGFDEPWWINFVQPILNAFPDLNDYALAWTMGTTGNLSTSRELLAEAGGFDERFNGWGLEDTELCYRLVRAGARVQTVPAATNYHQPHPSVPDRFGEWNRNFGHFASKFDDLEVLLYFLVGHRKLPFDLAHQLARECQQLLAEGRPLLVEELTRRYRELATTLLPTTAGEHDA